MNSSCPVHGTWETYAQPGVHRSDRTLDEHLAQCSHCREAYFSLIHKSYLPQIPNCHIVGEIGRGRFGIVYKAWWVKEKPEVVALKLLHSFGEMEKNRFEREIAVLTHLVSPGIVRCRDSGGTGDARYFVMDYIAGTHFDEFLNRSELDLPGKLRVWQRVCRAVADAHAAGVVHRDLKPRNILVDAQGQPHILDFGICSVSGVDWTSLDDGTITLPGDIIGTLKYMSPEQAWGGVARQVNQETDIWALGIMLYEIVTDGDYPYSLKSTPDKPAPEALLERIRKEMPRMPRLNRIPRGRDLETLIERCLAWEPDRRLSSAAVLADDVERFIHGEPIRTRPHGLWYRTRRVAVGAATRSRAPFYAVFIAAVLAGLSLTARFGGVGWRVRGGAYTGTTTASSVDASDVRERVRMVGIGDATAAVVIAFANQHGFPNVTENVTTWRGVHGRLLERLAKARPAAVMWDYYFHTAQPADEALAAGIHALEEAGTPVVLAARTFGARGAPDLSPRLLAALQGKERVGMILARDMVQRPGEFVIAVKRSDLTVIPSLTLVAHAAMLRPAARLETAWYKDAKSLDLLYAVGAGAYARERDRVELTRVLREAAPDPAIGPGDLLGCIDFTLHPPPQWSDRMLAYESLLILPEDELRRAVAGKVLIVGDVREERLGFAGDRHAVRYAAGVEASVPGCFLHGDAMVGIMEHHFLRRPYPLSLPTSMAMLALAFAGCALAIPVASRPRFDRPARRRGAYGAAMAAAAAGALGMGRSEHVLLVHLFMGGAALATPLIGSLWVEFTRNRHRVLDRQTRALRPFGSGSVSLEPVSAAAE